MRQVNPEQDLFWSFLQGSAVVINSIYREALFLPENFPSGKTLKPLGLEDGMSIVA